MSIKPAIKPGDWVRLGHDRHPDFRIEGIVQESFSGYLAVGETPFGLVGGKLFYGYTVLDHVPFDPDAELIEAMYDTYTHFTGRWSDAFRALLAIAASKWTCYIVEDGYQIEADCKGGE